MSDILSENVLLFPMSIGMTIVKNPNALGTWEMKRQVIGKALYWSICGDVDSMWRKCPI